MKRNKITGAVWNGKKKQLKLFVFKSNSSIAVFELFKYWDCRVINEYASKGGGCHNFTLRMYVLIVFKHSQHFLLQLSSKKTNDLGVKGWHVEWSCKWCHVTKSMKWLWWNNEVSLFGTICELRGKILKGKPLHQDVGGNVLLKYFSCRTILYCWWKYGSILRKIWSKTMHQRKAIGFGFNYWVQATRHDYNVYIISPLRGAVEGTNNVLGLGYSTVEELASCFLPQLFHIAYSNFFVSLTLF